MKWNIANFSFSRFRRKKSFDVNANAIKTESTNYHNNIQSDPMTQRRYISNANGKLAMASMATVTFSTFYAAEWSSSMPLGVCEWNNNFKQCHVFGGLRGRTYSSTSLDYQTATDRSDRTKTTTTKYALSPSSTNNINKQFLNTLKCEQSLTLSKRGYDCGDAAFDAGTGSQRTDSWMRNFDCVLKRNSTHLSPSSTSVLLENYL